MEKGTDGLRLTLQERLGLQRRARSDDEPSRARVRATVVLMSAQGFSARAIARTLGIGKRTVRETRHWWRRESFEGLYDSARSGRPPKADRKYLQLLRRVVRTNPRTLGYGFAHWTAPRLAEYLRQRTGIRLVEDRVRRLLRGLGFVWRKTKLTTRHLCHPGEKKTG